MRRVFLAVLALMLANYLAMALWTTPRLMAAADGLPLFDLRPFGYGFHEARAYLAVLNAEGRETYLIVQHWLDTTFPALLALSLILALHLLLAPRWLLLARAGSLVAVAGAVFDYLENAAVAALLRAGAQGITPEMVTRAGVWTVAKSAADAVAITLVLGAVAVALWRRWNGGTK
ncbi:hypothetical protein [Sediminimonas sp.]|uniref:hypothetical protein n=1 Tax=Sediminimonas sp. TaxID=2823379 RepID=UPI0025CCEA99|nr:hypothetical protein [Sediminimonas sp.]